MLNKGEIIAALVALGFKGHCGPFGGEDPVLEGNTLILESMMTPTAYTFNDDGSVDISYPEPERTYQELIDDCDYSEEEAKEIIDNPEHYNNIFDLLNEDSLDGWFCYWDYQDINAAIQAVLNITDNKNEED